MIKSIRHRGLRRLYENGDKSKLNPDHISKFEFALARLENARSISDVDVPWFKLHRLKGQLSQFHSIQISGNWRVIFRFEGGDVWDVDYLDYH